MKRTPLVLAALTLAVMAMSCASAPPPAMMPPSVMRESGPGRPQDALTGVGVSTLRDPNLAITAAETRASASIARQLGTMLSNMVNDYAAGSEADPGAFTQFTETAIQVLARAHLRGVSVVTMEQNAQGHVWVVVRLSASNAHDEIVAAAEESIRRLQPHQREARGALARMDQAFRDNNMLPVPVVDSDD